MPAVFAAMRAGELPASNQKALARSVGLIQVDPNSTDKIENLIAKADASMYEEKRKRVNGNFVGKIEFAGFDKCQLLSIWETHMYRTKARILCVDDQEDMHAILTAVLGRLGHEVVSADNPLSGLVIARNQCFDLFILDSLFTDSTGIDLCKRIRELDRSTPVVFFSGDSAEAARRESFKAGAQAYLTKPDLDGLVSTVNELLAERL